jgi:hypothetical protein
MTSISEVFNRIYQKEAEAHFVGGDGEEIDIVKEEGTGMYVVNLIRNLARSSIKDIRTTHLDGKLSPNHRGWSKKSRRYNNINTQ